MLSRGYTDSSVMREDPPEGKLTRFSARLDVPGEVRAAFGLLCAS